MTCSQLSKTGLVLILILLLLPGLSRAEKLTSLPDVMRPDSVTVEKDRFYVTEGVNVYIYSLKDFKLLKKFGKMGEGPREFRGLLRIFTGPDHLVINSLGKISLFTKDGVYKSETRSVSLCWGIQPVQDYYIGYSRTMENEEMYNTVNIFDAKLNRGVELYRRTRQVQRSGAIDLVKSPTSFVYILDKSIFLNGSDDKIHVYDLKGTKTHTIDPRIKKRSFTPKDEERYRNYFKNHPRFKAGYQRVKDRIKFPSHFPGIRFFAVTDGKLVVLTYRKEKGNTQCLVLDPKGKLIKKTWLPYRFSNELDPYPFHFSGGKFYQLIENEEEEEWEIHVTSL